MPAKVNESECTNCGACTQVCPEIAIICDNRAVVDDSKCIECGACTEECPTGCITVRGPRRTEDRVRGSI